MLPLYFNVLIFDELIFIRSIDELGIYLKQDFQIWEVNSNVKFLLHYSLTKRQ